MFINKSDSFIILMTFNSNSLLLMNISIDKLVENIFNYKN